jgi:phosphopantothenoylcysteine decarboxylase / phosphopantothenate---cysteine ligase
VGETEGSDNSGFDNPGWADDRSAAADGLDVGPVRRPRPLVGKRVVLGVCGGIAAYKAVEVCRRLGDAGAIVSPVLTKAATRFVGRLTFSALAAEPARTSLFTSEDVGGSGLAIPHVELGRRADAVVVAPATARLIGSYAAGIASDLLSSVLLATRAPVLLCPAMHTEMWEHPAVQYNLALLHGRGVHVLEPAVGRLAGGDVGQGRLREPEEVVAALETILAGEQVDAGRARAARLEASLAGATLRGVKAVVSAGGTREPLDPVRYIGNRSSGKQGYAIAAEAAARGARVILVTTVDRAVPPGVAEVVTVGTAAEMEAAVVPRAPAAHVVVMAAAVADFRPKAPPAHKLKKDEGPPDIVLEPTHDFLVDLGRAKPAGQVLVGFAAETDDLLDNARRKLDAKHLDLIVANDVGEPDAGFEHDTNRVTIIGRDGTEARLPLASKADVARAVVDAAVHCLPPPQGATP